MKRVTEIPGRVHGVQILVEKINSSCAAERVALFRSAARNALPRVATCRSASAVACENVSQSRIAGWRLWALAKTARGIGAGLTLFSSSSGDAYVSQL